jgi:uncharacterized protein (DUF1330 family)
MLRPSKDGDEIGLDITPDALERFLGEGGEGPIVLVNLVRLRPGGEKAYERYLTAVGPILQGVGVEPIYAGAAAGVLIGEERWDLAAVVRYPGREALAQLVRDPAFEATTELRHAALEDGLLYAFR